VGEALPPDAGPRRYAIALLTRIPSRLQALRCWFKTDRTRAIDRHIDYFGGAVELFAGRINGACNGAMPQAPTTTRSPRPAARCRDFESGALVHLDALYRTALRLTGNRADAEDLVQDACLRAFENFDRFKPGTNCRAWLFTIMRNVFLNRIRYRGREVVTDSPELESAAASVRASNSENPEAEFFQRVVSGDVERALRALPLAFREAVILVDLEGFSYREAAEALGCPVGTVMSRLYRGRRLLRHGLRQFVHPE
jgi:RNA polymerase sigma-70 factor (ECF subfamily)